MCSTFPPFGSYWIRYLEVSRFFAFLNTNFLVNSHKDRKKYIEYLLQICLFIPSFGRTLKATSRFWKDMTRVCDDDVLYILDSRRVGSVNSKCATTECFLFSTTIYRFQLLNTCRGLANKKSHLIVELRPLWAAPCDFQNSVSS